MQPDEDFFYEALTRPVNVLKYHVTRQLTAHHPDRAVLPTSNSYFDVEAFAREGHCQMQPLQSGPLADPSHTPLPLFEFDWWDKEHGIRRSTLQAIWNVSWEGQRFDLVQMEWAGSDGCNVTYRWLIASTQETAERFFATVCEWNGEVRGEVLVFSGGYWQKSEDLYRAIRSATFDNLILPGGLKSELRDDLRQFFGSRAVYERYGIPWKRGLLLVGPPGNGKTHTIKALLNWLDQPCLYVKSLKARYGSDHDCIKAVFERARQTTPCLLVMEDLDSLITDRNRSFFLNELDGFAANTGIVLVATTNHPDRLDPAIMDRPSRFDRKYHFPLPAPLERASYVALWNANLEPEVRLSEAGQAQVVAETDGFSFAYLKELFLSSMMRWVNAPQPGGMDAVMAGQWQVLREQMNSAATVNPEKTASPSSSEEEYGEEDEDE